MRALIITGGECSPDVMLQEYDLCIAADSGFDTAMRLGIFPDLIVGDFDSVTCLPEEYTDPETGRRSEIIRHPAKKNETDTMLAASYAVERGATDLHIIGGLGGRVDHTVSNMFLLEKLRGEGVTAALTDGEGEMCVLKDGDNAFIPFGEYRYFSLFALDKAEVSATGCAYPLELATLVREDAYAVSNEPLADGANVVCHKGTLLLVKSERLR